MFDSLGAIAITTKRGQPPHFLWRRRRNQGKTCFLTKAPIASKPWFDERWCNASWVSHMRVTGQILPRPVHLIGDRSAAAAPKPPRQQCLGWGGWHCPTRHTPCPVP